MRSVVVSLAVGAAFLLPSAAAGHSFDDDPRLTLDRSPDGAVRPGTRVTFFGQVKSDRRECRVDRTVVLMRSRSHGPDVQLGSDETDDEGEFGVTIRVDDSMVVYARIAELQQHSYGHDHECEAARSNAVRVRVGEDDDERDRDDRKRRDRDDRDRDDRDAHERDRNDRSRGDRDRDDRDSHERDDD